MSSDKTLGGVILVGSIGGIIVYFWLLFMSPWSWLTIQVSAFAAVAAVLMIIAWIGYTLATTPPPVPLEDLDLDTDFDDLEMEPEGEAEEEEEKEEEEKEEEEKEEG